jgi:hypothetical protein
MTACCALLVNLAVGDALSFDLLAPSEKAPLHPEFSGTVPDPGNNSLFQQYHCLWLIKACVKSGRSVTSGRINSRAARVSVKILCISSEEAQVVAESRRGAGRHHAPSPEEPRPGARVYPGPQLGGAVGRSTRTPGPFVGITDSHVVFTG